MSHTDTNTKSACAAKLKHTMTMPIQRHIARSSTNTNVKTATGSKPTTTLRMPVSSSNTPSLVLKNDQKNACTDATHTSFTLSNCYHTPTSVNRLTQKNLDSCSDCGYGVVVSWESTDTAPPTAIAYIAARPDLAQNMILKSSPASCTTSSSVAFGAYFLGKATNDWNIASEVVLRATHDAAVHTATEIALGQLKLIHMAHLAKQNSDTRNITPANTTSQNTNYCIVCGEREIQIATNEKYDNAGYCIDDAHSCSDCDKYQPRGPPKLLKFNPVTTNFACLQCYKVYKCEPGAAQGTLIDEAITVTETLVADVVETNVSITSSSSSSSSSSSNIATGTTTSTIATPPSLY